MFTPEEAFRENWDVIVDALFGIGLSREISGKYADIIKEMNDYYEGTGKVAVDIASGISATTGAVLGTAFRADMTVTFGFEKRGQLLYPGAEYTGTLKVADIGFTTESLFGMTPGLHLLEKEDLHNETAQEYLEVLERQSSRLKKLIEDLIEASKASTGNLPVHLERLEAGIFMTQTVGEFEEKTKEAGLDLVIEKPETPVYIMADSRHFWRVIDNLMNNICKYAQSGTRVYINLEVKEAQVSITFRNTSKYPLNISSDELMERFVRGDASRNTEGSGLGLSIANSLMDLMGGTFRLYVDGDLFKVVLGFAETAEKETKEKIEEL